MEHNSWTIDSKGKRWRISIFCLFMMATCGAMLMFMPEDGPKVLLGLSKHDANVVWGVGAFFFFLGIVFVVIYDVDLSLTFDEHKKEIRCNQIRRIFCRSREDKAIYPFSQVDYLLVETQHVTDSPKQISFYLVLKNGRRVDFSDLRGDWGGKDRAGPALVEKMARVLGVQILRETRRPSAWWRNNDD